MWVVIFRAKVRQLDAQYHEWAALLRDKALNEFGCTAFHSLQEGDEEIALSYWPSEAAIAAWKNETLHRQAQTLGRTRWYASHSVTIAEVKRESHSALIAR